MMAAKENSKELIVAIDVVFLLALVAYRIQY